MNKQSLVVGALTLVIGVGAGYWLAIQQAEHSAQIDTATLDKAEREVLFYRNPMNPAITSPVPAQDEMGMDYIPVYADEGVSKQEEPRILFYRNPMNPAITSPGPAQDEMGMDYIPVYADQDGVAGHKPAGTVEIDPVTVQNIGVRTGKAEQRSLGRVVRAVARVDYDEEHLARLHPKTEGWIEELYIDKTGEQIAEDTILLNVYAPQLVTTQHEYLLALDSLDAVKNSPYEEIRRGARELVRSARERLELLDVPEHQIRELEQTRKAKKNLHIHSPFDGVIVNIGAREGQYVTPKTELYMIADLSNVWVFADVYENELPWIQVGDPAEMRLAAIPGQMFKGQVDYIYPYAEARTRTIKVRMAFENPELLLKPDMFADVTINAQRQIDAVVIPSEAVVRSGEREQVFVVRGPGKFEPREVELGVSSGGFVQVVAGISPGEEVVTSSQFLIDSESKLREATAKMLDAMSGEKESGGDHDQGDH